jgi:hypothetical protein
MGRNIIFKSGETKLNLDIGAREQFKLGFRSEREILRKRSQRIVKILSSLDAKSLTEVHGWQELMDAIAEEYGTAEVASVPLGIVAKCFLGAPFEVHILDLSGTQIVRHFKAGEEMPPSFEKARTLAMHNAYAFVEVYSDKIVLVRPDGSATKL